MKEGYRGYQGLQELVSNVIEAGHDFLAIQALFVHLNIYFLDPEARDFAMRYWATSMFDGRKRSMAKDAPFLLGHYRRYIEGADNIPKSGPVIFIANHWGQGPLIGHWASLLISEQVSQKREDGREAFWIKQNSLHIPGTNVEVPFSRHANKLISQVYPIILVEDPFCRGGNKNGHETAGVLNILKIFRKGGMIGLYPEARVSTTLRRGHPKAGSLLRKLARLRPDAMVCPVGEWTSSKDSVLHLNIGEPFAATEVSKVAGIAGETEENQAAADYLMDKIKPLVPESLRIEVNNLV